MKYSGIVSIALSALVAASPTAPPAKFALQVTANGETLFLAKAAAGKSIEGFPVEDKAKAAACSIVNEELICDGEKIGINMPMGVDMVPIAAANAKYSTITKGFSIDAGNKLHFKSEEFKTAKNLKEKDNIAKEQGGEALFGSFVDPKIGVAEKKLYFQLGCPGGTHKVGAMNFHAMVRIGTGQAIPL